MFVRISETKTKYGKTYQYLKLVSGYRDKTGKVRQKVISLGRVDLIKGKLDKLIKQLRKYSLSKFVLPNEVKADTISMWGPVLLARALWEKIGMDNILDRLKEEGKRTGGQNKYQEIKLDGRRVFMVFCPDKK